MYDSSVNNKKTKDKKKKKRECLSLVEKIRLKIEYIGHIVGSNPTSRIRTMKK